MAKVTFLFLLLIISLIVEPSLGKKSSLIAHCEWYNRFDFDTGVIFSCNASKNGDAETQKMIYKNQKIYFGDTDGVECVNKKGTNVRYCNKQMIDAIRFNECQLYHIPYTMFKSYPYLRVLDVSKLELDSLQPEHLIGAKGAWELLAGNNVIRELPAFLFTNAGCVTKVDLSFNKIERIDEQTFVGACDLTMLDLSGNRIQELNEHMFHGLVNLTHMNLAYNQINQIHPYAFVGLKSLFHLDASHNSILILKNETFANLTKLNRLQLSYNSINEIESLAFASAHSLLRLDLSHNNITDEQIFDNLYNLLHLDLSHNPLEFIGIGTFASLIKLEHLDLGHTNLSDIELGTFSYQRGLISLDLSENSLKSLDIGLFLPAFRYMESLYLDGNKLQDLNGFNNSVFPRLNALGITNNRFNCSYLKQFMQSVKWEQIRLPVDRMPLNIHQTNIRGVACDSGNHVGDDKDDMMESDKIESQNGVLETNLLSDEQTKDSKLNEAIEQLIKLLPASNSMDSSDSDVKVVKLRRQNGSNIMMLVW